MKLYTEEQVINALQLAHSNISLLQNIIERRLTPIELPSDEEINEAGKGHCTFLPSFVYGAKWMRDKIQEQLTPTK
jgi:hypothetical protein